MKKALAFIAAGALCASFALPMTASAELEELQVHGQIRIRGNYVAPGFFSRGALTVEALGFDDDASTDDFYNALVEVNFTADMSDDVTGYIALRSYDIWGGQALGQDGDDSSGLDDSFFGGVHPGGALALGSGGGTVSPTRAGLVYGDGNDPVAVYQAYIQMDNVGGYPVTVKIGRQEIPLGREYLVGNADAGVDFGGHAFDALLVAYDNDESFRVTAFTAKLGENRNLEEDADADLHAAYATYYGLEALDIDAYWIWMDNGSGTGVNPLAAAQFVHGDESENIHTLGIRGYGTAMDDRLTWNAEFAYQFGDQNETFFSLPANQSVEVDAWSLNVLAGYTFDDVDYRPEVHLEYAFFSGDDDLTDNDLERFNRLFSDVHYGKINLGGFFDEQTTNTHIIRVGGSAEATDAVTLYADLLFFIAAEDDLDGTAGVVADSVFGVPQIGQGDDDIGTELDLWGTWQYSEDLILSAGWSHFFSGDAIENSFGINSTFDTDDLDYFWWQAHLLF